MITIEISLAELRKCNSTSWSQKEYGLFAIFVKNNIFIMNKSYIDNYSISQSIDNMVIHGDFQVLNLQNILGLAEWTIQSMSD